ncbi:MarR family winged helix-turn-helix transcriptional regulator [Nonlabens marinus]|uniref:Transcriptional regulator, MarR family n=1 Tax=Nonlabens marinus S1-08 TaxID=1454201 RepID=W8VWT6_9FLAO|nr:MarR family transcriptional regulator [Nonlabens marinus]BAO56613.1 transcriptional regulator, MarR family [Nonlabens marinus S1-08]
MKKSAPAAIPLSRKLITTIIKKATELNEAIAQVLKEESLTTQQFNVLRILRGRHGEPASLQDVSKDMLHSNSNTTRVVDKLVSKNYVDRIQSPEDRRQIELTITDNGLELLSRLDARVDQIEALLTKNISEIEMQELINKLHHINN